jgi:hypothetical protein
VRIVAARARVTLDTSVYVSAFQFGGGMRLLHMAINGEIAVSRPILEEVIRVLREKFHWDGYRLHDTRQQILGFARLVTPKQTLDVVKEDEPDNRILECAAEAGSISSSPPIRICYGWEATLAVRSCEWRISCNVRKNNGSSRFVS